MWTDFVACFYLCLTSFLLGLFTSVYAFYKYPFLGRFICTAIESIYTLYCNIIRRPQVQPPMPPMPNPLEMLSGFLSGLNLPRQQPLPAPTVPKQQPRREERVLRAPTIKNADDDDDDESLEERSGGDGDGDSDDDTTRTFQQQGMLFAQQHDFKKQL